MIWILLIINWCLGFYLFYKYDRATYGGVLPFGKSDIIYGIFAANVFAFACLFDLIFGLIYKLFKPKKQKGMKYHD